ncbi:MAG: prolyl oligopeptidase family serine peptidase [Proteobacteria bacterium]|nr:prolyl oligopeptidase family serine peptidase [Pseudomonadota bacterium]
MNLRLAASLLLALTPVTALADPTAPDPQLSAWLQGRDARLIDWLPDGTLLISTRFGEVRQLHRVASPLGQREQLSFGEEPAEDALPSAQTATDWIQLQARGDGSFLLLPTQAHQSPSAPLAPGLVSRQRPIRAHDGHRIAYGSHREDGENPGLTVLDPRLPTAPQRACPAARAVLAQDWSYDDARVLLIEATSSDTSTLQVCDLSTGKLTRIEPDAGTSAKDTQVIAAQFSRDGRGVYFVSTHGDDFTQLRYVDQYTRESRVIARQAGADITQLTLSADGRWLAWTVAEAGGDRLVVRDQTTARELALAPLPAGAQIGRLAFDGGGTQLALSVDSAQAASEVLVYTLTGSTSLSVWTHSEQGLLPDLPRVTPQQVRFASWDGDERGPRQVPAWLYQPPGEGPHPVLIDLPDSPGARFRPGWDPLLQHLVMQQGWAVIAPQLRGSGGYGRNWQMLDNGKLREDPLRDLGALLVWIRLQPDLDANRVVLRGSGYGAYQVMAALAQFGDRLAGGITVGGFGRFAPWLYSHTSWQRELLRSELGDERDSAVRETLERISPLTRAGSIRKPLLMALPPADAVNAVVVDDLQTLGERVLAHGVEVTTVKAPNAGPAWHRKAERDVWLQAVAQFLRRRTATQ